MTTKLKSERVYLSLEGLIEREYWHVQDSFSSKWYSKLAKSRTNSCSRILDVGVGSGIGGTIFKTTYPSALIYGVDIVQTYYFCFEYI